MTDQITRERALDLLRQAVNQEGYGKTYVYPHLNDCQYLHDGRPSCIVGHALHLGGWTIADLQALDNQGIWDGGSLNENLFPPAAARALGAAQDAQDQGRPWGEALAAAEGAAR